MSDQPDRRKEKIVFGTRRKESVGQAESEKVNPLKEEKSWGGETREERR